MKTKRDKKIELLFKKGLSPLEIAKELKTTPKRVLKTLNNICKPDKEKDIELYILKRKELEIEKIKIYRNNGFFDSVGSILDTDLQKGGL